MKSPYASELQANQLVSATFLVQFKDVRQKKTGESFLNLVLADRTGDVEAKMWDNVDKIVDTFEKDDFVRVKGVPQIFQNRLQFTVHSLTRVDDREVDLGDFLPSSKRDPAEMFAELRGFVAAMTNPHLKALLEAVLDDPEIARKIQRAPAAKTIHHAWLGGLLEHIVSLARLCKGVAPLYQGVDQDLVLAGVVLHDIGKIDELTYDRSFGYSDVGQLLGHIHIGLAITAEKAARVPDFPARLRVLLEHMILSHHGELEFGSPKTPMFAEAMLLHHLDNLDSKMDSVRGAAERENYSSSNFSGYVPSLERQILRKERFLNPPAAGQTKTSAAPKPAANQQQRPSASNTALADQLKKALTGS